MPTIWGKYRDKAVERIDSCAERDVARMLFEYKMAFAALPGQHEHKNWKLWAGKKYPVPTEGVE